MILTSSYDILKKINPKKLGTYHYYSYICNVQWYKIQKLIFHILKDFKEAVCEYRLFSIFYARSASWISAPT